MTNSVTEEGFHLRGNYAPVPDEALLTELTVEGAIPPDLDGLYVRNGPNPQSGTSIHWFVGDGMLHGVRLKDGKALWYKNRWVRTKQLEGQSLIRDDFTIDHTVAAANTHIVPFNKKLFALVESSFPTEVTPELETLGPYDFNGKLQASFTAHPKICPRTGEMHAFGYQFVEPYLTYHRIGGDGALLDSFPVPVKGPTMIHDFALTERYVVFMDLPIVFDMALAGQGRFPYQWSDDYGARLGVMPRGGSAEQTRWFEIEPCYVFHPANAFDTSDGQIIVDVARYPNLWQGSPDTFQQTAHLHRWQINLTTGAVSEQALDNRAIEFPRIDDRRTAGIHQTVFAAASATEWGAFTQIVKYDFKGHTGTYREFGADAVLSEFTFVPGGPGQDEGWLMGYVYSTRTNTSDFVILDASQTKLPEVARLRLPRRVPQGFHGNWMDLSHL